MKRGRLILLIVVGVLLVIVTSAAFLQGRGLPPLGILGGGDLNYSIIIFAAQWIIIMIIIIFAYLKYITNKNKERKKVEFSKHLLNKTASQTDFDILYNLLKEEKSLSTRAISTIFKIKRETALEWAKILESNELAIVDYPAFGDPEVIFKEEKKKEDMKKSKKGIEEDMKKMKKNEKSVKTPIIKKEEKIEAPKGKLTALQKIEAQKEKVKERSKK